MPEGKRSLTGITSLIFIAISIVLLFFVVLSGVKHTSPLKQTFFLEADTSSIPGARARSQWTYFYICGAGNTNCGSPIPALPFGAPFVDGTSGVPAGLVGSHYKGTTSTYYYYMWRFGWVTYLIALVFDVLAFFTAMLAPCSRLASGVAGLTLAVALFFMSIAAALMTATFVKARNEFKAAGMSAQIGKYAFGFTWAAWLAMLIAFCLLFAGVFAGRKANTVTRSNSTGNTGFFRRQRRTSARRSFVDTDSQRRVKDEYA